VIVPPVAPYDARTGATVPSVYSAKAVNVTVLPGSRRMESGRRSTVCTVGAEVEIVSGTVSASGAAVLVAITWNAPVVGPAV